MAKTFSIGFSPCPNDCFIFDAMVNGKIDNKGYSFQVHLEDVETLNQWALQGKLDITKLSFHAFALCMNEYQLLDAGSALGFNCGPLLICKENLENKPKNQWKVAIPGELTTANFLLSIAFPEIKNKINYVFSDIENAVLNQEVDAGLIIHESRFTYQNKGLKKIKDLGEFWDEKIKAPIPLGGIAMKRQFELIDRINISNIIAESVRFAFKNPKASENYVCAHAQELDNIVINKHINLYVNNFSVSLGREGRKAVQLLMEEAYDKKIITKIETDFLINL
jgi:1,4-dihydroxy-6-naphthoate synthase